MQTLEQLKEQNLRLIELLRHTYNSLGLQSEHYLRSMLDACEIDQAHYNSVLCRLRTQIEDSRLNNEALITSHRKEVKELREQIARLTGAV